MSDAPETTGDGSRTPEPPAARPGPKGGTPSGGGAGGYHFADDAARYRRHRPVYPAALVDLLAGHAPGVALAWEAGCGSGQLSVPLARAFERVVATDGSAAQIARAPRHPRIDYRHEPASACSLPDATADLCCAAQAAHWFDRDSWWAEVRRVGRPGGLLALVSYGRPRAGPDVDPLVHRFHEVTLARYWPPERHHVDEGYRGIEIPFDEIPAPPSTMEHRWTREELTAYVRTWSGTRALVAAEGPEALHALEVELRERWDDGSPRTVSWPLALRLARIPG